MAKICFVGLGYVGLVTGTCLADFGNHVIGVDSDKARIESLAQGIVPFYEPGLDDYVARNLENGRLAFTDDLLGAINASRIIFIAVGTPSSSDGSANLDAVFNAARFIAEHVTDEKILVVKSTVPVGTCSDIDRLVRGILDQRGLAIRVDVVSNPEFLREGTSIYDFTHPDKVVIGTESASAQEALKQVYRVLYLNETPFVFVNRETSELIKYANNAFLAMKVSFINELSGLCEKVGANVQDLARAIGRDGRIGSKFLHAGPGYGGSCFPKDTKALAYMANKAENPLKLVEATIAANEDQKARMVRKITDKLGTVTGKTLAILGLTFKPNTDDVRDSPVLDIIEGLLEKGAVLKVFDPMGMKNMQVYYPHNSKIMYCNSEYSATESSDALIITTEWHQFRNLDFTRLGSILKSKIIFDLRNIYDPALIRSFGFEYIGVGVIS